MAKLLVCYCAVFQHKLKISTTKHEIMPRVISINISTLLTAYTAFRFLKGMKLNQLTATICRPNSHHYTDINVMPYRKIQTNKQTEI